MRRRYDVWVSFLVLGRRWQLADVSGDEDGCTVYAVGREVG